MVKKIVVYATMAGDLFHRGHLEFINQAKKLGDVLIIGLHPDDIIKQYKRTPIIPFEDRKKIIEAIKGVNFVVEDCMNIREPKMFTNLKKYIVNIVAYGKEPIPALYTKIDQHIYKVVKVNQYLDNSTTKIIEEIQNGNK